MQSCAVIAIDRARTLGFRCEHTPNNKKEKIMKERTLFVLALILMLCLLSGLSGRTVILTENFDTGSFVPTGWKLQKTGSSNDWTRNTTATYSYSPNNCLGHRGLSYVASNAWIFTKAVNLTAGKAYVLEFYQRTRSAAQNMKVTVGSSQTSAGQTNVLLTLEDVSSDTYEKRVTEEFVPDTSGTYYFAMHCYTPANSGYLYVDDIAVYEYDSVNPKPFVVSPSSHVRIDLNWSLNANSDNVLLAWNDSDNFGTPSGSYSVGNTITGGGTVLLANSSITGFTHEDRDPKDTYYYRIWSQRDDGVGSTDYSPGVTGNATTFAPPINSFPWMEDFTGIAQDNIPEDWDRNDVHWRVVPYNFAGGESAPELSISAFIPWETKQHRVVTPHFVGNAAGFTLSFKHWVQVTTRTATYAVEYSTDNGSTWQTLWSLVDPMEDVGPGTTETIDIAGINGTFQISWLFDGYIRDTYGWYIDDIELHEKEGGHVPVELSSFTATISVDNFVNLKWITQSETGVAGFYVLRNDEDDLASAAAISSMILATNGSQQQVYLYTDSELYDDGIYYYWLQSSDIDGTVHFFGPISIEYVASNGEVPAPPLVTEFSSIFPNPFNPTAFFNYSLKESVSVQFEIYNVKGELVRLIPPKKNPSGTTAANGTAATTKDAFAVPAYTTSA